MYHIRVGLYLAMIFGGATATTLCCAAACPHLVILAGYLFVAPIVFTTVAVSIAGSLSRLHHRGIVPGTFARSLQDARYRERRLYGLCWTAVYYCTPLYFIMLSIPPLQNWGLWLFKYPGTSNLTLYPDTWIRDWPLLRFGKGVYLSNRATIGTNIVLSNGDILVGPITLGDHCLIGHLAVLAPNVVIGDRTDIGVQAALGLETKIGGDCRLEPQCLLGHAVQVGDRCVIGMGAQIGTGCRIASGVKVPQFAVIPKGTAIESTQEARAFAPVDQREPRPNLPQA